MNVKFEYISTKKPKWHIYHTNNKNETLGSVITFKNNDTGTQFQTHMEKSYDYTSRNDYIDFFHVVMDFLQNKRELLPFDKDLFIPIMEKVVNKYNNVRSRLDENLFNNNAANGDNTIDKENINIPDLNNSETSSDVILTSGVCEGTFSRPNREEIEKVARPSSEESQINPVGAEPSVYRHSDTLPMASVFCEDSFFPTKRQETKKAGWTKAGKGESGISPLQDNIDTYKLEAEHQAATAIVEANMAEFHAERAEIKEKEREEREALIAEASRLTGRVEAFNVTSKFVTVTTLLTIKNIKESGVYKELPNIKTWADYCKSIGFSREKIDLDLQNLNTFGEEFMVTSYQLGLGYRDLRSLSKQVKSGSLEVRDAEVIIDGEVIPLDDKDELRDALDTLLKSKYKEIEEKDKLLKDKEMQLEVVRETKDGFARRMDKAEEEAAKYKKEIEKLKNNKPSFKNVSDVDAEDFQKLLNLEQQWRDLFNALRNATDDDNLSSFNKSMLGGIVAQMMLMLDDFRMQLNGKSEFYFHGVEMDEEMLNEQISPSDYMAIQNEK